MRTKHGTWCVGLIAAIACCAGAAVAKPEKGQQRERADKSSRMTAVKPDGAEPVKVVSKVTNNGKTTKTVEVSREKADEGLKTSRHATVTTASGVTVVRDDTRTRDRTDKGKSSTIRAGTTVVTDAQGQSKSATRSSLTSRDGRSITRMTGMTGPGGKSRSVTTTVVLSDDGVKSSSAVTRRSGAVVQRELTHKVEKSPAATNQDTLIVSDNSK